MSLDPLQPDEPAYIQFSSGSTAEPKGIRISQEAVCHNVGEYCVSALKLPPKIAPSRGCHSITTWGWSAFL
ncbi:fatty acyl-AMP ligase [Ochrobactrum haematophilum]|uniref:Fatty acyl-AMP ligase n=1 Tax=Brucella haematophila TaxID=419474 RepID=A0ABX1DP69_9HYPH|nr:fatty acyl-AMP ligase [Brucella haematophila]